MEPKLVIQARPTAKESFWKKLQVEWWGVRWLEMPSCEAALCLGIADGDI